MAKKEATESKVRLLGTVKKVHDSGVCDTDKGFSVNGKFAIGDILEQDIKSKKVTKKVKNAGNNKNTATEKNAPTGENVSETVNENVDATVNIGETNNANDGE